MEKNASSIWKIGRVWFKAAVLKTADGRPSVGSNPTSSVFARVAQLEEHMTWGDGVKNTLGKQGPSKQGAVPRRSAINHGVVSSTLTTRTKYLTFSKIYGIIYLEREGKIILMSLIVGKRYEWPKSNIAADGKVNGLFIGNYDKNGNALFMTKNGDIWSVPERDCTLTAKNCGGRLRTTP